jgi:tRNA (adenine22-N1)-methyltransferase
MELKLTDRMQVIADFIGKDEIAADIGTDHGYIPIWLLMNNICRHVILADVNKGPLKRAEKNFKAYLGSDVKPDIRLGSGIQVLGYGEADTVIIAGMGGILIRDILADDMKKTASLKKLVLQPRNNSDVLRRWIYDKLDGFTIISERVVKEGRKFSEILCVVRDGKSNADIPEDLCMEIPYMYLAEPDETVGEYLRHRLRVEETIMHSIMQSGTSEAAEQQLLSTQKRIDYINRMIEVYNSYGIEENT